MTTSPGSTTQNMVPFGAGDEFAMTFAASPMCRLESKHACWYQLGKALKGTNTEDEVEASSPPTLMLSSLLHPLLSCPCPQGQFGPLSPSQHGPAQLCSSQDPTKAKGLVSNHSPSFHCLKSNTLLRRALLPFPPCTANAPSKSRRFSASSSPPSSQ